MTERLRPEQIRTEFAGLSEDGDFWELYVRLIEAHPAIAITVNCDAAIKALESLAACRIENRNLAEKVIRQHKNLGEYPLVLKENGELLEANRKMREALTNWVDAYRDGWARKNIDDLRIKTIALLAGKEENDGE
jgi:hypothetical protein